MYCISINSFRLSIDRDSPMKRQSLYSAGTAPLWGCPHIFNVPSFTVTDCPHMFHARSIADRLIPVRRSICRIVNPLLFSSRSASFLVLASYCSSSVPLLIRKTSRMTAFAQLSSLINPSSSGQSS